MPPCVEPQTLAAVDRLLVTGHMDVVERVTQNNRTFLQLYRLSYHDPYPAKTNRAIECIAPTCTLTEFSIMTSLAKGTKRRWVTLQRDRLTYQPV